MAQDQSTLKCPQCNGGTIQSSKLKKVRTCRKCGHEWDMFITKKGTTKKKKSSRKKEHPITDKKQLR